MKKFIQLINLFATEINPLVDVVRHVEKLEDYLNGGGDPNAFIYGRPLLGLLYARPEAANLLLRAGANPTLKDFQGMTAFEHLIAKGMHKMSEVQHLATVDLFLKYGSDVHQVNTYGVSILETACAHRATAQKLMQAGARPSSQTLRAAIELQDSQLCQDMSRLLKASEIRLARHQSRGTPESFISQNVEPLIQRKIRKSI